LQSILNLADVRQRLELRIFEPENVHDPNLVLVVVVGEKWIDFEYVAETVAKKGGGVPGLGFAVNRKNLKSVNLC
jgi:hypothetical protein